VTSLESSLRQIHADLTLAGASFALVGGLAVSARTEPRFTRDADLAVAIASDAERAREIRTSPEGQKRTSCRSPGRFARLRKRAAQTHVTTRLLP
jgi:hypothetical protein